MAAMQFSCPHCGGLFQVDSSLGGQQVSCPHCRGVVALPAIGGYQQPGAAPAQYPAGAGGGYPAVPGGGVPGYGGQEAPVRPPAQVSGFPPSGLAQPLQPTAQERPLRPAPGFPYQPQMPVNQERPLGPAPGFPAQPQMPTSQERPLQGPQVQRPLRPMPLGSQPAVPTQLPAAQAGGANTAGDQIAGQMADPNRHQPRGYGGPQIPSPAPTVPTGPAAPAVPTMPRPRPGGVEQRVPSVPLPTAPHPAPPARPEVPLSSPGPLGGGMPVPSIPTPGAARLPMSGPQPTVAPLGGVESLLPPGPVGDRSQPRSGGPIRPIVLPTPDGGVVRLRDPVKMLGSGDDAIELRSRSAEEKEAWRFKKNLIMWVVGLLLLGITIIILMLLGPIQV